MEMQETQLATALEDIKNAVQRFEDIWKTLEKRYQTLRAMEPGPLKAAVALQTSRELKAYLEAIDHSPLADQKRRLYDAYKYSLGVFNRARKRAEILEKYCKDIRSDWEAERRRQVEDVRQKREEQAVLFAEKQREAEVKHLKLIGKTAEAEAKAEEPMLPITVNVDPNMGKPEGEVMVEVWQPKRDETGEIVFSDMVSYLAWLADNPPLYYLVKHEYGKLKKLLTDSRGMLQPPGLEIEHKWEPRTRREADDGD